MNAHQSPSWAGLGLILIPFLAGMALLAWRRWGQVDRMAIALVRLAVQLSALGIVLTWLFERSNAWLTLAVLLVMLIVATQTVAARNRGFAWEVGFEAFAAMAISMIVVLGIAIEWSLAVRPWYEPKVIIPLAGMILGNSVSAVALAAERLHSELRADRDRVETRLSLGASRRLAALPATRAAIKSALTPVLNNMMIAGIVAIPGMATGQLLAGANVAAALRYQFLIYLGIASTVCFSTILLLEARLRRYFTKADQLCVERLGELRD
jgi:putative ABC transport system permease protein